ncbi:MAG: GNAT family N-acetyltransferase [Oscillospiraceae bacterium]|nr:GNAT family N-acetyltransferase [Oscillospiraceae bacterium]
MFNIKYVSEKDKPFWLILDRHFSDKEFELKIRDKRGYVISDGDKPIGVMRYNLMWDYIPFLTLIHLDEAYQRKGFGRQAMLYWENEMRELGHDMVMTSTQVDEQGQFFYRKLGYVDKGALFFDDQPQEMFMLKVL